MSNKKEKNNDNENNTKNDINLLLKQENIFSVPEIYKQDYRWLNEEEKNKIIKKLKEKNEENSNEISNSEEDILEENDNPETTELKKVCNNKKIRNDTLYSFKIDELIKLEKYLKIKLIWQDHIIDQYMSNFLLNTYRNENNDKNLWVFFNFGPSWSWKNYIMELIAEKLDFWIYILDLSWFNYIEISSILWATDGYSNNDSIMENISNIAQNHDWKMILIFDEIEKWLNTENWNITTFFNCIMNIINNKEVYTKNNSLKIDLSNFIFIFNSNIWFDEYENKLMNNHNKIWFNVWENKQIEPEKNIIDSWYIENYFKNELKINISVYNRLHRWDNFFFFNSLNKKILKEYFIKEFRNLKVELCYNFQFMRDKLPDISLFKDKIKNFDYTTWFRWINNLIYIEIKLFLIKNYIFKKNFKKWKLLKTL